jgi:hypothetical protein
LCSSFARCKAKKQIKPDIYGAAIVLYENRQTKFL